MVDTLVVAELPAIQRQTYLSRVIRRVDDAPVAVGTLKVSWEKMVVNFASEGEVSAATVSVESDVSLSAFARRLECLLDMAKPVKSTTREWKLDFIVCISQYGDADAVRRALFDAIYSVDAVTGETIGAAKCKRRSKEAGVAKLRMVPQQNLVVIKVEHTSAAGLKAVWKTVLARLEALAKANTWDNSLTS